jgi:hypothetical protein
VDCAKPGKEKKSYPVRELEWSATSHGTPADSSELYGCLRHHPTTDHVASEARPQTGL